jgi:GMP synthase (glutamine-hydrolysing)
MKIHVVKHAAFENLGTIRAWAEEHDHSLIQTHTYKGEKLPCAEEFDFLIVMGGPQSPLALEEAPYLKNEIDLIKKSIDKNKAVLGICLGAQLIGEALGAKTEKSPHKEIGMHPISLFEQAKSDPIFSNFSSTFDVMHWHNDMPGLSNDAVLLARSEGCPRQAFRYGDRVYGFQFHMESTHCLIEGMIKHCAKDFTTGKYIKSPEDILNTDFISLSQKMKTALNYFNHIF